MAYSTLTVRPSNLDEASQRFRGATGSMQTIAARGWHEGQDFPLGYLLVQDGTVSVGQLLCIYRARSFDGQPWLSANMSTWFVAPDHRGAGLKLLTAMHRDIAEYGAIATVLAPGGKARTIYQALRYSPLGRDRLSLDIDGAPVTPAEAGTWFDPVGPADAPPGHDGLLWRFDTQWGAVFVRPADVNGRCVLNLCGQDDRLKNNDALYDALAALRDHLAGRGALEVWLEAAMVLGTLPRQPLLNQGWRAGQTRLDRLFKGAKPPEGALDFLYTEAVLFGSRML